METLNLFEKRFELSNRLGNEELIFSNWNNYFSEKAFYVKECGITYPNPDYRIVRNRTDPELEYMYIMEYVLEGKGCIETDDGVIEIEKGDTYIIGKNTEAVYYSDKNDPLKKLWINVGGLAVDALAEMNCIEDKVSLVKVSTERHFDNIHDIMRRLNELGKHEVYRQVLHQVSDIMSTVYYATNAKESNNLVLSERIRMHIDNSPYFQISIAEIAAYEHYSERHINRVFGEQFGMTPKQYIQNRKIDAAKDMLIAGRHSVKEISVLLGFCDEHHFMNTFKRIAGTTINAFREDNSVAISDNAPTE